MNPQTKSRFSVLHFLAELYMVIARETINESQVFLSAGFQHLATDVRMIFVVDGAAAYQLSRQLQLLNNAMVPLWCRSNTLATLPLLRLKLESRPDVKWESWLFLAVGQWFTVQNLDQMLSTDFIHPSC